MIFKNILQVYYTNFAFQKFVISALNKSFKTEQNGNFFIESSSKLVKYPAPYNFDS